MNALRTLSHFLAQNRSLSTSADLCCACVFVQYVPDSQTAFVLFTAHNAINILFKFSMKNNPVVCSFVRALDPRPKTELLIGDSLNYRWLGSQARVHSYINIASSHCNI